MSKKIALTALFTSLVYVLSYIETFIPIVGIPGVKLGLGKFGHYAFPLSVLHPGSILYQSDTNSLSGFMFCKYIQYHLQSGRCFCQFLIVMVIAKKQGLSMVTVGILAECFIMWVRLLLPLLWWKLYSVYSYIPVLIISGMITGTVIGVLSFLIKKRAGKYIIKMCKE